MLSVLLFTVVSLSFVQDWLSRYGYLPPADPRTSKLQTKDGLEKAIRVMQRFGGVQETGVLGNNQKLKPKIYSEYLRCGSQTSCNLLLIAHYVMFFSSRP